MLVRASIPNNKELFALYLHRTVPLIALPLLFISIPCFLGEWGELKEGEITVLVLQKNLKIPFLFPLSFTHPSSFTSVS